MRLIRKPNDGLRIVIVGGGYAGLATLVTLRERSSECEIILIDPRPDHIKVTQIHESFRSPSEAFKLPYHLIEKRFSVRHLQTPVALCDNAILSAQSERMIPLEDGSALPFDYLVLATGTGLQTTALDHSVKTLTLSDFLDTSGPELLEAHLGHSKKKRAQLTVVGSGPTGIQFLFEIAHYVKVQQLPWKLRLIDSGPFPLRQFEPSIGRYVMAKLEEWGIDYFPAHYFLKQGETEVTLEHRESFERQVLQSDLTLYFSGKNSRNRLRTNWFGQVKQGHKTLSRIFSAGDAAHFQSPGSNSLSAQSAVRKGKLVAQNILRQNAFLGVKSPYLHRDLGYIISMGPTDAIGWVGSQKNVIAGSPALAVKNVVESQYDLLLAGTNTFAL